MPYSIFYCSKLPMKKHSKTHNMGRGKKNTQTILKRHIIELVNSKPFMHSQNYKYTAKDMSP
jgi:hypothetical protein